MRTQVETLAFTLERVIPAPVEQVFDAWLDPSTPGKLWHGADKLVFDPKVDGMFYVLLIRDGGRRIAHYGLFTRMDRPHTIQHTFVSPNTRGLESMVTLTFREKAGDTQLTLRHEGLPDDEAGRGHEKGWSYFLGLLEEHFAGKR